MLEKPLFHGGVVELCWIAGGMASGACATVVKTIQDHSDVSWQWYDWASCQHRLSAPGANQHLILLLCWKSQTNCKSLQSYTYDEDKREQLSELFWLYCVPQLCTCIGAVFTDCAFSLSFFINFTVPQKMSLLFCYNFDTRELILIVFWQKRYWESKQSKDIISHLT